jgi:hypothetical protein
MKNELAKKLYEAAVNYKQSLGALNLSPVYQQDFENLTSIATMIENNEDAKAIQKAMWNLDTAVRDVIPNKVYYTYN